MVYDFLHNKSYTLRPRDPLEVESLSICNTLRNLLAVPLILHVLLKL